MATSKHFKKQELECPCCAINDVKQPVVDAAEWIRARAEDRYGLGNVRLRVTSAYRCPTHNAAIRGAVRSCHKFGTAMDLELQIRDPRGWITVAPGYWEDLARQAPGVGGYGRDDQRKFAHIDTRKLLHGKISQWCYESRTACAYYPFASPYGLPVKK
jgi:hypothetical protein